MSDTDIGGPDGEGLKILVIHAANRPPDRAAVTKLLRDAGLSAAHFKFVIPSDIVDGKINPKDFDRVLTILTDELEADEHLEGCKLIVAQCGTGDINMWDENTDSNKMHPAGRRYGTRQIPWDPKQLSDAVASNTPQGYQTSGGKQIEPAEQHKYKYNTC